MVRYSGRCASVAVISGIYDVRILQFRDGVVFSKNQTNIYIKSGGLSAMTYNFAHDYSLFYGLFAVAAVVAGCLPQGILPAGNANYSH